MLVLIFSSDLEISICSGLDCGFIFSFIMFIFKILKYFMMPIFVERGCQILKMAMQVINLMLVMGHLRQSSRMEELPMSIRLTWLSMNTIEIRYVIFIMQLIWYCFTIFH